MCAIRAAFKRITGYLAAVRSRSEFSCGDCERWERCGLAPTDACVVRAAQLERMDRRLPRRYLQFPDIQLPRW